jgi:hypothetical protein
MVDTRRKLEHVLCLLAWRSRQAGIGPDDVQVAMLYDHFTPFVLVQLEELGFCGRG